MTTTADQPEVAARGQPWAPWQLYVSEAVLLGTFMLSACVFTVLLHHPSSPVSQAAPSPMLRRFLTGIAMGTTAVLLIYSPPGRRSGALMNPAVTLTFLRLRKISPRDALFYIVAQFVGGAAGVALSGVLLRMSVSHASVNYAATVPGKYGAVAAWLGEFAITFVLMSTVMSVNRFPRLAKRTGLFAGALVALYITFEAPLSGMSMNPARTFASALSAQLWTALWVYFTAPVFGMLCAAELHQRLAADHGRLCGKFSHSHDDPCVFRCHCLDAVRI